MVRRSRCKECGGSEICRHGRSRYYCEDCGGKGICDHGKQRNYCNVCNAKPVRNEADVPNETTCEDTGIYRELMESDFTESEKENCAKLYHELNYEFTEEDKIQFEGMFWVLHAKDQTVPTVVCNKC